MEMSAGCRPGQPGELNRPSQRVVLRVVGKFEQVYFLRCVNSHQSPKTVPLIVDTFAGLVEIVRRFAVRLARQFRHDEFEVLGDAHHLVVAETAIRV